MPLATLHDWTSRRLFEAAVAALAAIAALYVYEVAARYVFDAPTTWTIEGVSYALSVVIFAALPEATRRRAHVAIDILPSMAPARAARVLRRGTDALGAVVCGAAAWIIAAEALRQAERGLMTNAANPVPKWPLTAIVALGLGSAAVHFLRHAAAPRSEVSA